MAHDAAVHIGENGFQVAVSLNDFLLIGPLLGHVDAHADGAHDAAVQIVERGLVGGQQPHALSRQDGFLGYAGALLGHDHPLRLNAGGIVLLHIPDIGVPPALDLRFRLVDRPAEAVVHLFVNAVLGFVPDQAGNAVDGGLQKLAGLPRVLFRLVRPLPAPEAKAHLLLRHGHYPDVLRLLPNAVRSLSPVQNQNQPGLRTSAFRQRLQRCACIRLPQIGQDDIRLRRLGRLRRFTFREFMTKPLQRGGVFDQISPFSPVTGQIEMKTAMVHNTDSSALCVLTHFV